jgi:hypothetical protein
MKSRHNLDFLEYQGRYGLQAVGRVDDEDLAAALETEGRQAQEYDISPMMDVGPSEHSQEDNR